MWPNFFYLYRSPAALRRVEKSVKTIRDGSTGSQPLPRSMQHATIAINLTQASSSSGLQHSRFACAGNVMYSTPTPIGRPSALAGAGNKFARGTAPAAPSRPSLGTSSLASPTYSTTSTSNKSSTLGRKSLSSTTSSMPSSPAGSRSTSLQHGGSNATLSTNGSPETLRVGDSVRAPGGEVGIVKYSPLS